MTQAFSERWWLGKNGKFYKDVGKRKESRQPVIVIFENELREMLGLLGQITSFGSGKEKREAKLMMDTLVDLLPDGYEEGVK